MSCLARNTYRFGDRSDYNAPMVPTLTNHSIWQLGRFSATNILTGQDTMTLIRGLEIENFRAVKGLRWLPGAGVNCLIGPGDSGKSTILDAIDYCVGARPSVAFTDADFHGLGIYHPVH